MFLAGSPVSGQLTRESETNSIIALCIFSLSPPQIFFQSPSHFSLCLSPLTSLSVALSLFMGCVSQTVGALWWLCILPAGRQLQLSLLSITTCHHIYALNIKSCGRREYAGRVWVRLTGLRGTSPHMTIRPHFLVYASPNSCGEAFHISLM